LGQLQGLGLNMQKRGQRSYIVEYAMESYAIETMVRSKERMLSGEGTLFELLI